MFPFKIPAEGDIFHKKTYIIQATTKNALKIHITHNFFLIIPSSVKYFLHFSINDTKLTFFLKTFFLFIFFYPPQLLFLIEKKIKIKLKMKKKRLNFFFVIYTVAISMI